MIPKILLSFSVLAIAIFPAIFTELSNENVIRNILRAKTIFPTVTVKKDEHKLAVVNGEVLLNQKYNEAFSPSPDCTFTVTGLKYGEFGNITTPNYPRDYPTEVDCLWTVESELGTKIRGVIFDFETQGPNNNSAGDPVYLSKDGSYSQFDRMIGDLNEHTPLPVDSEQNKLVVRFRSDLSEAYRGFKLLYIVEKYDQVVDTFPTAYDGVCGQMYESPAAEAETYQVKETEPIRVIGNKPTKPHQYPWMVALLINDQSFCGGTIIDDRHILTAAHCTDRARKIIIVIGAYNLSEPVEPSRKVVRVRANSIFTHPEYNFNEYTITHDIAILRLPEPLIFCDKVKPICLPRRKYIKNFYVGETVQLSGWGQTADDKGISPVLQHTDPQNVITNKECRLDFEYYINGNIMCMNTTPTNAGCRGDSGGPLFSIVKENDSTPQYVVQLGITSFTGLSCEEGDYFAFTRVTAFLDYIEKITGRKLE